MEHHDKSHKRGSHLQLVVVTPEATVLEETAEFVALPLYDGEVGIAPLHSPMIGRLGYGEMRVKHADRVSRYYVDGGFVQVVDDVVSVLTSRAVPAGALDGGVAGEQLAEARRRPANTPELMALRERAELQARAQLRVARHAAGA
ncbi:MAG TPA: ATP synthase F1 subunit epsilon [Pirellulales bacterium]|nr:ATP synthase F1 subunit epsilon [Pirellulales bacterium]